MKLFISAKVHIGGNQDFLLNFLLVVLRSNKEAEAYVCTGKKQKNQPNKREKKKNKNADPDTNLIDCVLSKQKKRKNWTTRPPCSTIAVVAFANNLMVACNALAKSTYDCNS